MEWMNYYVLPYLNGQHAQLWIRLRPLILTFQSFGRLKAAIRVMYPNAKGFYYRPLESEAEDYLFRRYDFEDREDTGSLELWHFTGEKTPD